MVHPQRATADDGFRLVPAELSTAATRYQRSREIEKEHLARMARHNLLEEWSDEVTATVLAARERIQDARVARDEFRLRIQEFVFAHRGANEPLSAVLRHTRSMLQLLETTGVVASDGGWFEAEVLEWAIEFYEGE
jgi:hypothetical protein